MVDTGPPYPHPNPVPGSNAIGEFIIGTSPIGTIPPFDFWVTVISQFGNSPTLYSIIQSFNDAMDLTEDLDNLYDMIWNVLTATGYGLDVWGRIVGISRVVQVSGGTTQVVGFQETGDTTDFTGWGQAPWSSGPQSVTNYLMPDDMYRRAILAKAATNISDGSILSTNAIMLGLFPNRGPCYVVDGENMTIAYTFLFPLTDIEVGLLGQNPYLLPKATGVAATVVQI